MKRWIFVLVGLLVAFTATGCLGPSSKDISGIYTSEVGNKFAYKLKISQDGTYEIYKNLSGTMKASILRYPGGKSIEDTGTYKLKGNQITLISNKGPEHEGKIKDDKIIIEAELGSKTYWVKQ